ncbi:hypothetical protein SUGI_0998360 [Cryptomeria japonica]|nr:hypothetical protein SUGI_0998360 [Cryptomeria japonica]
MVDSQKEIECILEKQDDMLKTIQADGGTEEVRINENLENETSDQIGAPLIEQHGRKETQEEKTPEVIVEQVQVEIGDTQWKDNQDIPEIQTEEQEKQMHHGNLEIVLGNEPIQKSVDEPVGNLEMVLGNEPIQRSYEHQNSVQDENAQQPDSSYMERERASSKFVGPTCLIQVSNIRSPPSQCTVNENLRPQEQLVSIDADVSGKDANTKVKGIDNWKRNIQAQGIIEADLERFVDNVVYEVEDKKFDDIAQEVESEYEDIVDSPRQESELQEKHSEVKQCSISQSDADISHIRMCSASNKQ